MNAVEKEARLHLRIDTFYLTAKHSKDFVSCLLLLDRLTSFYGRKFKKYLVEEVKNYFGDLFSDIQRKIDRQ